MTEYFYVRPERDNWHPTVNECRQQLLRELLKGATLKQAKDTMYQRFQNVSKTYWDEFWDDVVNVPLGRKYVRG